MELLKSLSIKNHFSYHKDRTQKVETIKLTYNEEVQYNSYYVIVINHFLLPYSCIAFRNG